MGTIVSAKCKKCHFGEDEMYLGSGLLNHKQICSLPYVCNECNEFFIGNYLKKDETCKKCSSKSILPYTDLKLTKDNKPHVVKVFTHNVGEILELTNNKYFCPYCKSNSLEFSFVGMWD